MASVEIIVQEITTTCDSLPVDALQQVGEHVAAATRALEAAGCAPEIIAPLTAEMDAGLNRIATHLQGARRGLAQYVLAITGQVMSNAHDVMASMAVSPYEHLRPDTFYGGVTDPAKHNPDKFRYLVHGINPIAYLNSQRSLELDIEEGVVHDPDWGDQRISAYEEPECIAGRVSLSMSLIDETHTTTWGSGGLIIGAPPESIVITHPRDAGARNHNRPRLLQQKDQRPPQSAEAILEQSDPNHLNEIVALGTHNGQRLQTLGFFIVTSSRGTPYDAGLAHKLRKQAERLNLPLITITQPSYEREEIRRTPLGIVVVQSEGWKFTLDLENIHAPDIQAANDIGKPLFPSPDRVQDAVRKAHAAGAITDYEMAGVLRRYHENDAKRRRPTLYHAEEGGPIQGITCTEGYEDAEQYVIIQKGGATRTNTYLWREIERFNTCAKSDERGEAVTRMSIPDTDVIMQRLCEAYDNDTAERLRVWYASVRDTLA